MSDYRGGQPVFKKPALPSRYQRASSYNRASSDISNASEYSPNKIKEKIEVLERAFLPNDDIWEKLGKNIDHLCFVKLTESVLQPDSQRSSSINNGNLYPNVLTLRTNSNCRFNSTSSTINTRDFTARSNLRNVVPGSVSSSSQYHDVRPRNVEKSDDVNSRNIVAGRQYSSHRLLVQNGTFQAARSSRSRSRSSSSTTSNEENDLTLESQSRTQSTSGLDVVVPPPKKRATESKKTETSSKVDKRRSQSAESSNPESRKRSKKEETVKESTQRVCSASKTATKPATKLARLSKSQPQKDSLDLNGSNDSVLTFFRKQRQFNVKKPAPVASSASVAASAKEKQGATRKTQDSQSSQSKEDSQESSSLLSQNSVTVIKKSANTRKTKSASNTQQSEAVKSRVKKTQITVSQEKSISEDDCSQTRKTSAVRTGNARKPSKTKTAPVKKPAPTRKVETTQKSPSIEGDSDSDELDVDVPARKKNQKTKDASDVRPKRTVKKMHYGEVSDLNASQDDTLRETKITKKPADPKMTNRTKGSPLKKPKLTAARSKTTRVSPAKSSAAVQKKKAEAVLQAKDSLISNSVNREEEEEEEEEAMGESFFSDVSSIAGNGSVSFLCPEKKRKSKTQPSYEMDGSMQFFSPFTSANLRSTSAFSAASTPLSKSVAKNVLGKRVKKPSVVAELKNELKENRKKKKKLQNKPNVVQPIHETTASTESECEASDFSD